VLETIHYALARDVEIGRPVESPDGQSDRDA
jgi:hypothetical protein